MSTLSDSREAVDLPGEVDEEFESPDEDVVEADCGAVEPAEEPLRPVPKRKTQAQDGPGSRPEPVGNILKQQRLKREAGLGPELGARLCSLLTVTLQP